MAIEMNSGKIISDLRATMERAFPGCVRYAPVVQDHGYALAMRGGLTVAYADPADSWFLYMTAGIAKDVTNITSALEWANEKNSNLRIGRFYASVPAEGPPRCNVVYQCNAWSELLSGDYISTIMQMLQLTSQTAERAPKEFMDKCDGSPFQDSPEDISLLVTASFG
jgi:hypothetical protein